MRRVFTEVAMVQQTFLHQQSLQQRSVLVVVAAASKTDDEDEDEDDDDTRIETNNKDEVFE